MVKKIRIRKYRYILGAMVPLFLGVYLLINLYQQVANKEIDQLILQEELYAKQAVTGLESYITDLKYSLGYLSEITAIRKSNDQMPVVLKSFYENFKEVVSGITRIDTAGYISYTYPNINNAIGKFVGDQKHNISVKKYQMPIISDVFESVQGYRTIAFVYPVENEGKYGGSISFLIPFKYITKKFFENISVKRNSNVFVLSPSGIELYCTYKNHIGKSIFEIAYKDSSLLTLISKMLNGNSGKYSFASNSSESEVLQHAVYSRIRLENTFWSLGIVSPEDQLLTINSEYKISFMLILSFTFAAFFLFIIVYYKSKTKMENRLNWKDIRYRIIAEQTGQIIYEYNIEKETLEWSGAIESVTGYAKEEFKNFDLQKFYENIHEDDRKDIKEKSLKSIMNNEEFVAEYRFMHKSGRYIYFEDYGKIVIEDGKKSRLGTIKDITDRKLNEIKSQEYKDKLEKLVEDRTRELQVINEKLKKDLIIKANTEEELKIAKFNAEKSDRLKSEFLAQMSHEIRTPINTILSFSSLIKDELSGKLDEDLNMSFNGIGNAGKRIIRTIDLILNMSELQTGSYDYKPKMVNIYDDVLEPLVNEYRSISKEKDLKFQIRKVTDNFIFSVDEYTVNQMFANLIDNALKYTVEGEVLVICKKDSNENYIVEISDTGIGISPQYIPYLFDPFTQEDQGYTRKFEGNGLGLALVREYSKLNGALIEVESQKGVGTTFRVIFSQK